MIVRLHPARRTAPVILALLAFAVGWRADDAPPADASRSEQGSTLAARLADIDARAARIRDFTAVFEQRKQTALLKRPLVSSGTVRMKGSVVRWDTRTPEPSVLHSDGAEVRMYYPRQKLLEVFPIDERLSELAASPLPRLESLRKYFSIEQTPAAPLLKEVAARPDDGNKPTEYIALRLTPTDETLREHIDFVRVLLDATRAHMVAVETTDADGDRTLIWFKGVMLDTKLKPGDVALDVPPGTKVSRPAQGR